jgi:ribosomal-protein-alanine N-acetyltransferase
MSAVLNPIEAEFEPLTLQRLDEVLLIEQAVYEFPWSRGNFSDSLRSGYQMQLLTAGGQILGYFVAMKGVDEVHLLNLTVAPGFQRQGWARIMLDGLAIWSRSVSTQWLWLEVRVSNLRALQLYERFGFRRVGERKRYYPAALGTHEDAVVMSVQL